MIPTLRTTSWSTLSSSRMKVEITKSPIQIVQNFKTMVGYERRITTDEMGKYYADKQSVQRKAIHNSHF